MLTVYHDDSGTAPEQPVAIAAALLIPAAQIPRLEREWNTFKDKEGFSAFHTSEFIYRNKKSKLAKWHEWDDAKRDRVFARVRQICRKYGVRAEACVANKNDYDETVPDRLRRIIGNNHYTFATRLLGDDLDTWRRAKNIKSPLQFVFSWEKVDSEKRKEIETVMQQAEFLAEKQEDFEHWSFERMQGIPGLQCVDVIAWCSCQFALFKLTGKPVHEFAEIGLDDFTKDHWLKIIVSDRQMIKRWVASEKASGNIERAFTRWHAR